MVLSTSRPEVTVISLIWWKLVTATTVTVLASVGWPRSTCRGSQGLPGLILGDAHGVLPRMAQGGLVRLPRNSPAYIPHHQPEGPADGGVGPVPVAEDAGIGIDVEPVRQGAVEYD